MQNIDPFRMMFDPPYGMSLFPHIEDMIAEATGAIKRGALREQPRNEPVIQEDVEVGYAFVAMAINPADKTLEDTLDAIKEAAKNLGIRAERIDEQQENTRITDRILESIRRAEFVIVDLTDARPNVYYEAGFAQGLGKLPIYIAKEGSVLQFDIKDYPVLFWGSYRELKMKLSERLKAVAKGRLQDGKAD